MSRWKSQFISGLMHPIMMLVKSRLRRNSGLGSILQQEVRHIGDIQAFIHYVRNFTHPITQMAQVMSMLQSMAAAAERVYEFLDEEEEDQRKPRAR